MTKRAQQLDGAATKRNVTNGKRLGRRTAEQSRETRRALLDAAVVEFSEKGLNGARIDEIAARAGVTKGAIYTHFDGREDLLVSACRYAIRSLEMMRVAAEATELPSFMDETARLLVAPESRPARMLISELYASAMRSSVIADLLAEWHAEFVSMIRELLPVAPSPETIGVALNALHVALSHFDLYETMDIDQDQMLDVVNRLTAAVLAES